MSILDRFLQLADDLGVGVARRTDKSDNEWPDVEGPSSHLDRAAIIRRIQARNPRRWKRLESDFKWAQRVMKRMGRNPEDVRFLL